MINGCIRDIGAQKYPRNLWKGLFLIRNCIDHIYTMDSFKSIPCFQLVDPDNLNSDLLDVSDGYVAISPDHSTVSILSLLNTSKSLKLRFSHKISKLLLVVSSSQRKFILILFDDGSLLLSEFSENLDQGVFLTNTNFFIRFSQKLFDVELDAKHDSTHTSILLRSPQFSALIVLDCRESVPNFFIRNLPFGLTVIFACSFLETFMSFTS